MESRSASPSDVPDADFVFDNPSFAEVDKPVLICEICHRAAYMLEDLMTLHLETEHASELLLITRSDVSSGWEEGCGGDSVSGAEPEASVGDADPDPLKYEKRKSPLIETLQVVHLRIVQTGKKLSLVDTRVWILAIAWGGKLKYPCHSNSLLSLCLEIRSSFLYFWLIIPLLT